MSNFTLRFRSLAWISLIIFLPFLAQAHPGHGHHASALSGVLHPLSGWDHILAMVAVGLWAAQLGGRALWSMPLTFVSVMAIFGMFGAAGISMPYVEQGILTSVLVLGILIATAARFPRWASLVVVGLFAAFHGHAHGAEMLDGSFAFYGLGFIFSTALLHLGGIGAGLLMQKFPKIQLARFAGLAIAVSGLCLWLGW